MSNKILENIFSVTNDGNHRLVTISGIKMRFLSFKLLKESLKQCNDRIQNLKDELLKIKEERKFFSEWNFNPLGWFDNKLKYARVDFDNVRLCTLELAVRELRYNGVLDGAIAELGVFQGDFASKISEFLPDNRFYLFDTFEGFDINDKKIERDNNYSEITDDNVYSNTTEEMVLSKMTNPDRCVIRKGYFPETLKGMEELQNEQYIFVSIDADLYQPTIEGLKYFYPRLKKGGYIFVHDFNHSQYRGVKEAVYEYMRDNEIKYVPIPDISGSIVIVK